MICVREFQRMRFTWRKEKERSNVRKHGVDFSPVGRVFADPLAETVWDGFVNGEERWRTLGAVIVGEGFKVYPNPDDEEWVHVISLREATAHERKRYEISHI